MRSMMFDDVFGRDLLHEVMLFTRVSTGFNRFPARLGPGSPSYRSFP